MLISRKSNHSVEFAAFIGLALIFSALVGVLHQQASKASNVIPVVACRCESENPNSAMGCS